MGLYEPPKKTFKSHNIMYNVPQCAIPLNESRDSLLVDVRTLTLFSWGGGGGTATCRLISNYFTFSLVSFRVVTQRFSMCVGSLIMAVKKTSCQYIRFLTRSNVVT